MEEAISRIITELEEAQHLNNTTNPQPHSSSPPPPLSEVTLLDLQTLSDDNDSESIDLIFQNLASKSLSPSSLVPPLASTMDLGPTHLSLLASQVYLSLLLSPNSPVFTLFTPMSFLSLLSSIRRSLKRQTPVSRPDTEDQTQKKKRGAKARGSRNGAKNSFIGRDDGEAGEFDVRVLFSVLERLELVMGLIHLDRFPDSLKSLVQTMAETPSMAYELCGNSSAYNKIIDLCSRVLSKVLSPDHGDQANTASVILKALTPLIFSSRSQLRAFGLGFVMSRMISMAKESDDVKKALVNFPRYLANKVPEKSEPRALAAEAIMQIIKAMDLTDQVGFVDYVVKMTQGKANLRLLAVDLIQTLIMSLRGAAGLNSETEEIDSWNLRCLEALIKRCSDASAVIRTRALSNLSQLVVFLSDNEKNRSLLKNVMGFANKAEEGRMNGLLRKRCMDEKAGVRKAALNLVTKLIALLGGVFDDVLLKTMGMACSDPLVSIRKAAIAALSEAFRTSSDESVISEWLHSVPRLITDNESSIQEECEHLFLELVLDRICKVGANSSNNGSASYSNAKGKGLDSDLDMLIPKGVLGLLKEICNGEVTPWVKKICTILGKKRKLKPSIAISLKNIINMSESLWLSNSMPIEKWKSPPGAWFLLSEVSVYLVKSVDWEFLYHHWELLDKHGVSGEFNGLLAQGGAYDMEDVVDPNSFAFADSVFLLQTISNVSVGLPDEPAGDLALNLLKRVEEFNMHDTEVNAHVRALKTLCKRKASNPDEAEALVQKWVGEILFKAFQVLEKYISEDLKVGGSFITPLKSRGSRKEKMKASKCKQLSKTVAAVYTIGSLVLACPTVNTATFVPLLHKIITSGSSDLRLSKLPGPAVSYKETAPALYLQAWLTMAKICLADSKVAKSYIPLFVQELEKSDNTALRNNLVVTMADFCVRYTALVDCYITKITMCLCDPCELVRRQTFILLARLLQRDYVKWRGVLFLRFLLSLVDESEKIRQLADYLFGNILKVKAPLLAYNSFVEAIFVLNDCHPHGGHTNSEISRTERRLFSIRGNDEKSRSKRMHIYTSLLKQMAPEHLLATFAKLCAEILASASDGMLKIEDSKGQSVLQDAFEILSCKEIRIQSTRGSTESADMDEESADAGGVSAAAARGRAITQAVKKGLIQNTIPIFIELKRLLESKNSPLIGPLMKCLIVLLKDYKNEIDDMLVADKQLQKELIYDMQKYELEKAMSTAVNMQTSGGHSSPECSRDGSGRNAQNDPRLALAIADAKAEKTVRSVLKEVSKGISSPRFGSLSVPKLKTGGSSSGGNISQNVIESVRKIQSFDSDEEN